MFSDNKIFVYCILEMADEFDLQQSLEEQGESFLMQNRTFVSLRDKFSM